MTEIVIATRNRGKIREIEAVLHSFPYKLLSLTDFPDMPEIVEDGKTFLENAIKKARMVALYTHRLAVADDSGLVVEALQGRPGVLSSRYAGEGATDEKRYRKLLQEMIGVPLDQRQAVFVCAMAVATPSGRIHTVEGECRGSITFEPRGKYGFGYDPVFFVPEFAKTMAELEPDVKNRISHRARALEKLKPLLVEFSAI
jgi:XTP/dITP diphosphohydrolase